jgi:stearoyl-CoA desaturase (Delta-9 desaturase)
VYPPAIPFVLVHLACIAAFWTGVTFQAVAICLALYWLRLRIDAGYHRYFSHRAYRTSRLFQLDRRDILYPQGARLGLVWDLKVPPAVVRRNEHRLGSRVIERAAARL